MSWYFYKSFIKNNFNHQVPDSIIEKLIVRKPVERLNKVHPNIRKIVNKMTQTPEPLTYKLQELPTPDTTFNEPLGTKDKIPFEITRTTFGNLPVYSNYRNNGMRKLTIIRRVYGDVDEFKKELAKIVSNSEIYEKTGRIEVKGLHVEKINLWLRRLGF